METRHKSRAGEHLTVVVSGATPINYPDSQFEEPEPVGSQVPKNRKLTADAKWTETMMLKLAGAVFMHKAYMRTSKKMEDKYVSIKAYLLGDRDFEAFRDKGWASLQRKWENMMNNFGKKACSFW